MQSPPFPRYLVPPRSKYSPQHHVLKHPQLHVEATNIICSAAALAFSSLLEAGMWYVHVSAETATLNRVGFFFFGGGG